jgi:hypothetical protein
MIETFLFTCFTIAALLYLLAFALVSVDPEPLRSDF